MTASPFESAMTVVVEHNRQRRAMHAALAAMVAMDHLWIYDVINDRTKMIRRASHWKRLEPPMIFDPNNIGCAELPSGEVTTPISG